MDHDETKAFLEDTLAASIDPHDIHPVEQIRTKFLEETGFVEDALREQAQEAIAIGVAVGALTGDSQLQTIEAIWMGAFAWGYNCAKALDFKRDMEGRPDADN